MLVVRPARVGDIDALCRLAELAGPGFTSLQVGRDALAKRLTKSEASFDGPSERTPDKIYVLMLEDVDLGHVVGVSAVKAMIGVSDPYFNFRVMRIAQKSSVTRARYDIDVLVLVNEFGGATEVGTLFVDANYRGQGAGRLISQARYMLMAADPARFGNDVVAELRGDVDSAGFSPFWEAIGRTFFRMDFAQADRISAEQDNQFIADLMPKYPIYVDLLPPAAREVVGKTHPAGLGARRYLKAEGFRYTRMIDIFDAGPLMSAPLADIRTIVESDITTVGTAACDPGWCLVSRTEIDGFRAIWAELACEGSIDLTADQKAALGVVDGDEVRVWQKR